MRKHAGRPGPGWSRSVSQTLPRTCTGDRSDPAVKRQGRCLDLARLFGDGEFLDLATNHIQWIAGFPHGIPVTFVQLPSYLEAVPASFINCVGSRFALQYRSPWNAGAHHGPGGLVYWTNWIDNRRQLWAQYISHPHPTILVGQASGEVTTEMFDDYFTNRRPGS